VRFVPDVDWRRGFGWLQATTGPLMAVGAVALLWTMSTKPDALARVPDVTGLAAPAANTVAAGDGLQTRSVRVVHGGVAGTVVGQDPKPGAVVRRGEAVTLMVTTGAPQVVVPQVVSMPVDQARGVIRRAGLAVGAVVYRAYPDREPGRVVVTSPPAGSRVDQGSPVDLDVPLPPPQ